MFTEIEGDLFECPINFSLAHCVSSDFRMGRGIAVEFKRRFGGARELVAQVSYGAKGVLATLERDGRTIYYLVTKVKCYQKPTYADMTSGQVY